MLRQASNAITAADRPQGCVLQAIRRSLRALGWSMGSMSKLVLDEGVAPYLAQTMPPQQLKRYFREAYARVLDGRAWQKAHENSWSPAMLQASICYR